MFPVALGTRYRSPFLRIAVRQRRFPIHLAKFQSVTVWLLSSLFMCIICFLPVLFLSLFSFFFFLWRAKVGRGIPLHGEAPETIPCILAAANEFLERLMARRNATRHSQCTQCSIIGRRAPGTWRKASKSRARKLWLVPLCTVIENWRGRNNSV